MLAGYEQHRIVDLVAELSGAAHSLGTRLHPRSAMSLAELVRVMNCYYSNLIEGHNTTPQEIERALANQLDASEERGNLQIKAWALTRLQREVARLHAAGELPEPAQRRSSAGCTAPSARTSRKRCY